MLLVGALFALFIAGFWVYCLTDVALTPGSECRGLPKGAWLVIVAGTFVAGGIAWLAVRRRVRAGPTPAATGTGTGTGTAPEARSGRNPDTGTGNPEDPAAPSAPEGRERPLPPDGRPDPQDRDGLAAGGPGAPGIPANLEAEAALLRHPAGRARRPRGPDDDPAFLSSLSKIIHGPGDE